MTTWNQCSLRQGTAERVEWVRGAKAGAVLDGWTVAVVYAPTVGPCSECGQRTAFPGSEICVRCMP